MIGLYVTQETQSIEEQLENKPHCTDFTRAGHELGITVIHAASLLAKGRVERVNGILQDGLVKELRYAEINDPQKANEYEVQNVSTFCRFARRKAELWQYAQWHTADTSPQRVGVCHRVRCLVLEFLFGLEQCFVYFSRQNESNY